MKLSMSDLKNMTPVGEVLELEYEKDYNGVAEKWELKVYPLKTQEKLEIQALNDNLLKLSKKKELTPEEEKELHKLNEEINLKYAHYTMRKTMPDITEEFIKEKFPSMWFKKIFEATLKAEGINLDEIKAEKN